MANTEQLRDVVNAASLKSALKSRSSDRNDAPEVTAWMTNQFHRWIVSTFEHALPLRDEAAYQAMTGEAVPDWLRRKMAEDGPQPLAMVDPDHPYLCQLEGRCAEWLTAQLGTSVVRKFSRMTPPHVLQHWRSDHQRMAKASEKGLLQTSGKACKILFRHKGMHVVEFEPGHHEFRKELNNESIRMGHCVGQFASRETLTGGYGETYATSAEEGRLRLFSVRNGRGAPHVTISLNQMDDRWAVDQVKGKQNQPPLPKYAAPVKVLMDKIDVIAEHHPDCAIAGLFAQNGKYVFVDALTNEDDQMRAIAINPILATGIEHQTPAMKWMVALSEPQAISALKNPSLIHELAAAILDPFSVDQLEDPSQILRDVPTGLVSAKIDDLTIRMQPLKIERPPK